MQADYETPPTADSMDLRLFFNLQAGVRLLINYRVSFFLLSFLGCLLVLLDGDFL